VLQQGGLEDFRLVDCLQLELVEAAGALGLPHTAAVRVDQQELWARVLGVQVTPWAQDLEMVQSVMAMVMLMARNLHSKHTPG
jgi:hypothetical protein